MLDDDVAQLVDVEEEQVDGEVVTVDLEAHLTAHEREPPAELREGLLDPVHERLLELALGDGAAEAEEVLPAALSAHDSATLLEAEPATLVAHGGARGETVSILSPS